MKVVSNNSTILNPKCGEMGFIIGKYEDPKMYAAVPVAGSSTKLAIIHQAKILKVCRNRASALKFIEKHSKGKSVGKLPI